MVNIKSIEEFLDNLPKEPCPEILGEPYCSICKRINRAIAEKCVVWSGKHVPKEKRPRGTPVPGITTRIPPIKPSPAQVVVPEKTATVTRAEEMELRPEDGFFLPEKDAPLIEFVPPPSTRRQVRVRVISTGVVKKDAGKEGPERKEKAVAQRPVPKKKPRPVKKPIEKKKEKAPEKEEVLSLEERKKPAAQEIADKLVEEVFEATAMEKSEESISAKEIERKEAEETSKAEESEEKKHPVPEPVKEEKTGGVAPPPRPVKKPIPLKKPVKKAETPKETKRPVKKPLPKKLEKPEAKAETKSKKTMGTPEEKKETAPAVEPPVTGEKKKPKGLGLFKKKKEKPVLALVPEKELEKPSNGEEERTGPVVEAEAKPTPKSVKKGWEPIKKPKKKEDLLKKK